MNLYGRFILVLIKLMFRKSSFQPFQPTTVYYRVWPHDIDVNIHLTAARYFSFGDLGRIYWLACNGFLHKILFNGYRAVINAQEITYIREFRPFSLVELKVELKCWDEKYAYFEQRFYHKGELYAVSHARMAVLFNRKVVSLGSFLERFGHSVENRPQTVAIADWKETLKAKREHFTNSK